MNEFERCCGRAIGWIGKALEEHDKQGPSGCECELCAMLVLAAVNPDSIRKRSRNRRRQAERPMVTPLHHRHRFHRQ